MVTVRKRWPDPFNGGVVRDDSVDIGPSGPVSFTRSGSGADAVGHMSPPKAANLSKVADAGRSRSSWATMSLRIKERDAQKR